MIQGEDGQVHIAVEQDGCARIVVVRKSDYLGTITAETHTLKLDGQEQKDSPWFGGLEQYRTSAKFVGPQLQIKARTSGGSTLTMIYSLTPDQDRRADPDAKSTNRISTRPQGCQVGAKRRGVTTHFPARGQLDAKRALFGCAVLGPEWMVGYLR